MIVQFIKCFLLSLTAIFLVLEEWLWDLLTVFGRWVCARFRLAWFELWLAQSSRWVALFAFLIPFLVVMPLNVVAFWLLAKGYVLRGVVLEVFAKFLGMALLARVFALTRKQLFTFHWFVWLYAVVTKAISWAHLRLSSTRAYILAKGLKKQLVAFIKRAWPRV